MINSLNSKESYAMQNYCGKPTRLVYFESLFETDLDWKEKPLMPRKVTVDTLTRMFHYEIMNVLYLNTMLCAFEKVTTPLCSFCKSKDEAPIHLFFDCLVTQNLCKQPCSLCRHKLIIPNLTLQSAIFGFLESNHKSEMFVNLILLIFKLHIYNYRDSSSVNIYFMKLKVTKIRHNEEKISRSPTQKN